MNTLTITPDIWRLRRIHSDASGCLVLDGKRGPVRMLGIYLDGEYAVASDGVCLVAIRCECPRMDPRWRLLPHYPVEITRPITVPMRIGRHSGEPDPSLVEIVDAGDVYPNWRSIVRNETKGVFRFNPAILKDVMEAAGFSGLGFVDLDGDPDRRDPIMLRQTTWRNSEDDSRIAIVMPVAKP